MARVLVIEERKEERQISDGSDTELSRQDGLIDGEAWTALCFSITNLGFYVLGYAFVYDETGTVNPPWTDVFG